MQQLIYIEPGRAKWAEAPPPKLHGPLGWRAVGPYLNTEQPQPILVVGGR